MTRRQGWWVGLLSAGLVFGADCTTAEKDKEPEQPVVAVVAGMPIHLDEFRRALARVEEGPSQGLSPSMPTTRPVQKRVLLADLINRRLLVREAEEQNMVVGSEEVERFYERARLGWQDADFELLLADKEMTPAELRRSLRELLLIRKYYRDHVFSRVVVTDEEIEAHVQSNPEVMRVPEQVRAQQIVVKTEEEATTILREMRRGMSFEDAAMKYSLSPEAQNGGDLGHFSRGFMPKEIEETCFALPVGAVSKVVASPYGFHVFKTVERIPERMREAAEVRSEVELLLTRKKQEEAQKSVVERLRRGAAIEIREDVLARVD